MCDHAEEHAVGIALVWRYAKEHEVWKSCAKPEWRTEDTFLDSLHGHQTVKICIQFGTSTDTARRGKINIIHRNWGDEWYQKAASKTLLPQEERGAAGLSKRLLGQIADMSSLIGLEQALDLWSTTIQERTAVGSRKLLGWKAATTAHLLPCDLEKLNQELERREGVVASMKSRRKLASANGSDETLELRSSTGVSSLSPLKAVTKTYMSAAQSGSNLRKRKKLKPFEGTKVTERATNTRKGQRQGNRQDDTESNRNDYDGGEHEDNDGPAKVSTSESTVALKRKRVHGPGQTMESEQTAARSGTSNDLIAPDSVQFERSTESSSTISSTGIFIASVADGSALANIDNTTSATGVQKGESRMPDRDCLHCGGTCSVSEVPSTFDPEQRGRMIAFAHAAQRLQTNAPNETLRKWIRCIRYASHSVDSLHDPGEICVLSSQSFQAQTNEGLPLPEAVMIQEDFADSDEWSVTRYAELLETAFMDLDVDVRWHQDPVPKRVKVSTMAALCRSGLSSTVLENPPNMLNLPDITGSMVPGFLRMDRFRLLNLIIERCKADANNCLGKQTEQTPYDIASCRSFNLLAWPGAFSGAHIDSTGATWVRNLFGHKLWMFVPASNMTSDDWERLAQDGDDWDPEDKARAVVLDPGDIFVMRAGLVHAVLTLGDLGPCLMTGGSFFDDRDILHILRMQCWAGKNQKATNESLAYQLAQVILILENLVKSNTGKYLVTENDLAELETSIRALRSLGCSCDDCADDCRCTREGRRCTPLCVAHVPDTRGLRPCMLDRDDSGSENEREE